MCLCALISHQRNEPFLSPSLVTTLSVFSVFATFALQPTLKTTNILEAQSCLFIFHTTSCLHLRLRSIYLILFSQSLS